jgi:hypothetical protein
MSGREFPALVAFRIALKANKFGDSTISRSHQTLHSSTSGGRFAGDKNTFPTGSLQDLAQGPEVGCLMVAFENMSNLTRDTTEANMDGINPPYLLGYEPDASIRYRLI